MRKSIQRRSHRACWCCCNILTISSRIFRHKSKHTETSLSSSSKSSDIDATAVKPIKPVAMGETKLGNGSGGQALDGLTVLKKGPTLTNGTTYHGHSTTSTTSETQSSKTETRTTFTKEEQVTVLRETIVHTRGRLIAEIHHVDEHYIDMMSLDRFLDYIERERLTHMPHRGSKWDNVLKWAEFYALQISGYSKAIGAFVQDSKDAAKIIWAACRTLLELGPENAEALETTFGVFYKLGLSISFFLRHNELLHVNSHIRTEIGNAFNDMLKLVEQVSLHYYLIVCGSSSKETSIDFVTMFGSFISTFDNRKDHIIDAMWEYQLGEQCSGNIRTLRKWLTPGDPVAYRVLENSRTSKGNRAEYTCEWFQRPLLDFTRSKDDTFEVTGPANCGKSTLFGWIVERLQRPIGKKIHQTLAFKLEPDIPSQLSSLAVARNLALQLLESNVGDTELFNILQKAYNRHVECRNNDKLEEDLWQALETGMNSAVAKSVNYMIVVDGLHEMKQGKQQADKLQKHLSSLTSKCKNLQSITFAREATSGDKEKRKTLKITPDHTHEDMRRVTEKALSGCVHFKDQTEFEEEAIVELLLHAAKGDFLWVLLTAASLKRESSHADFAKAVKKAKDSPKKNAEMVNQAICSLDFNKTETRLLTSWLLVAERPLTTSEVKCLLQVDLQNKCAVDRKSDIKHDIRVFCSSLVVIENDFVRLANQVVRSELVKLQAEGKKIMSCKAAQTDLTSRLLAYCKFALSTKFEVTIDFGDVDDQFKLFREHALLEYAVRSWTVHFCASSMHGGAGSKGLHLGSDFKGIFPSSARLAMLEWACWESQTSSFEAVDMHTLALHIRQEIFSEKHESVLQNLVICGNLHKKLSNVTDAAHCFYRASTIGQKIVQQFGTFVTTCTSLFLSITETMTFTVRTETVTRREEMLKFIITAYTHQHGKTSDIVIRYYKVLAELYVEIHEEEHAETTWRELREIIIIRYGKGSEEERSISGHLTIVLKKGKKHEHIVEYEKNLFEIVSVLDVWDEKRIRWTLELAISYENRGEFFLAEELYVTLWRCLIERSEHHHHHHGVEIHIHTIDVVLEYVRFLRRRHRHEEACSVLICIWSAYEEFEFESEVLYLRLVMIGELMRAVSLLTICEVVFRKCWGWFSTRGKHEHTSTCEILIKEVREEIITTTTTTTTRETTTTTTTTETVVKKIFESTLTQTTVTSETISICKTMISHYMKLEKWLEAIEATTRALTLIWNVVVCGKGTCALPREFSGEAIEIAINLAICHYKAHRFHDAEEIYIRIYRACRNSCHIHDDRLTRAYTVLIAFYEEHHHWHKMIEIYQELLIEYRKHLGASHKMTIKILYLLGSLCAEHGHGESLEYYEEIVLVLNGDAKVCHHDSREAMIILCRMYYEGAYWHRLRRTCEVLWETWVHHHHEHHFEASFIEILYMRYRYVLEHHFHCEYEFLRSITIIYRDTCKKFFGAFVSITIRALIEYAQICFRSEKHIHEAITTYEEVLTTTTTTTTTTVITTETITTIKKRLVEAYTTVCNHESVTIVTIEKAIKIALEYFEHIKIRFGCAHLETLAHCRKLVLLYMKLKTETCITTVKRILVDVAVEIITKEKHSRALNECGRAIGEIFLACGLSEYGLSMLREMRRQIMTGTNHPREGFSLKMNHTVGKASFVFLITLQETLEMTVTSRYSILMSELLTETFLYERYTQCIKANKGTVEVLVHAARLRAFLVHHCRHGQIKPLEEHVFEMFLEKWGATVKTKREITFVFYISLMEELAIEGVSMSTAACTASINKVKALLEQGKYAEGFEVATCAVHFLSHQHCYHELKHVGFGFKLSSLLAMRGVKKVPEKAMDQKTRTQMLELSRMIIREVFRACKESKINFVRLQIHELNDLVGLLGEQENHEDLEWLLTLLWSSREVQKTWSSKIIIAIGERLVQARFLAGHTQGAIRLCEDICYNLRSLWGSLHPQTLAVSDLLCQLYTSAGHYREAMGVHENILRLIGEGDDGDDRTVDEVEPAVARKHIDRLKQSYLRLGGWDKSVTTYDELVDAVVGLEEYKGKREFQGVQNPCKWNVKDTPENTDKFTAPEGWEFDKPVISENGQACGSGKAPGGVPKRPRAVHRASSNWGMGLIHRFLHGDEEEEEEEERPQSPAYEPLPEVYYQQAGSQGQGLNQGGSMPAVVY